MMNAQDTVKLQALETIMARLEHEVDNAFALVEQGQDPVFQNEIASAIEGIADAIRELGAAVAYAEDQ
jgi:hypothetical protein